MHITNSISPRHSTGPNQEDHQRGQARSQGLEARPGGRSRARWALAGRWPAPSAAPGSRGGGRRHRAADRRRGRPGQAEDVGQGRQEAEEAKEGNGDLPSMGPLPLGLGRLRLGGAGDAGLQGGEGLPPLRPRLGRGDGPPSWGRRWPPPSPSTTASTQPQRTGPSPGHEPHDCPDPKTDYLDPVTRTLHVLQVDHRVPVQG